MKYLISITAIAIFLIFLYLMIGFISPYDKTITVIGVLKRRIELYVKMNNKLPDNLNSLPIIQGYDSSIVDGWNRKIVYTYDKKSREVTLLSYGEKGDCQFKNDEDCIKKKFKINLAR